MILPEGLTFGALIAAAIADSINPCEFGILLFLITTLAEKRKKITILYAGAAFLAAVFISYMLIGLGLCKAFSYFSVKTFFYYIIGALSVGVGIFNIYEFTQYDKRGCKFSPTLQKILNNVTSVPMMFVAGIFCSFFLLPCTAGPYVVISGILAKSFDGTALILLLIYNLIFILPMALIVLLSYLGHAFIIERMQDKLDKYSPLVLGIIMLIIGAVMLWYTYVESQIGPVCRV